MTSTSIKTTGEWCGIATLALYWSFKLNENEARCFAGELHEPILSLACIFKTFVRFVMLARASLKPFSLLLSLSPRICSLTYHFWAIVASSYHAYENGSLRNYIVTTSTLVIRLGNKQAPSNFWSFCTLVIKITANNEHLHLLLIYHCYFLLSKRTEMSRIHMRRKSPKCKVIDTLLKLVKHRHYAILLLTKTNKLSFASILVFTVRD